MASQEDKFVPKIGDLVWAKMKNCPPWPAEVVEPPPKLKRPSRLGKKKPAHVVFFFGSNNLAWLEDYCIRPYLKHREDLLPLCKTVKLKEAVAAIDEYISHMEDLANDDKFVPKIGDLVWAKMKNCPPWPAEVVEPPPKLKRPSRLGKKKPAHVVFFFGSHNFAWLEDYCIRPYSKHREDLLPLCKTVKLKEAVAAIDEYISHMEVLANDDDEDELEMDRDVDEVPPVPKLEDSNMNKPLALDEINE